MLHTHTHTHGNLPWPQLKSEPERHVGNPDEGVCVCLIGFAFAELQFNFTLAEALIKVVLLLLNHFEALRAEQTFCYL